jgi:hypothetical protein
MEFTTWPQVNMINQKNYYTCVKSFRLLHLHSCFTSAIASLPSAGQQQRTFHMQWLHAKCSTAFARARRTSMLSIYNM